MRADAIIFDLDGTLADTLVDIADAANWVLRSLSLPTHHTDAYAGWVGEGARRLVERALAASGGDPALGDDALDRFRARYGEHLVVHTRPYHGVGEMLDALTLRRIPIGVLSNKPHEMTRRIIDELFGRWRFAQVFGHRPDAARKPNPATALELADHLDLDPARCAFVGDTVVDMDTARAAGMIPVGVAWGFHSVALLTDHGAVTVLGEPSELLAWLDE